AERLTFKRVAGATNDLRPCLKLARFVSLGWLSRLQLTRMTPAAATGKNHRFDAKTFLATIGEGRRILAVPRNETIYTQWVAADAVFYVQKGKVRLTVVSKTGREATIGILDVGSFFGEGALAGQALR